MDDNENNVDPQQNVSAKEVKNEETEDCFQIDTQNLETEHQNDFNLKGNEDTLVECEMKGIYGETLEEMKQELDDSIMKPDNEGYIAPPNSQEKQKHKLVRFKEEKFFMKLHPAHDMNYFFENKIPAEIPKPFYRSSKISKERFIVYLMIFPFFIMLIMIFYVHYFPYEYLEPKMEFSSQCGLYTGAWSHDMTVLRLYSVPYAVQPTIENTTELNRNYFRKHPLGLRWTHAKPIGGEESCVAAHSSNCFFKDRWECYFIKPNHLATCTKGVMNKFYTGSNADNACLTLNIARPSLEAGKKVPIIFLITGFLSVYSPMQPPLYTSKSYEPDNNAIKKSGCLWVSVNYRLGINGHFLDIYDTNSSKSVDFALTDLKVALDWVRRNANDFGADPTKITILAQGSASTLVIALIEKYKLKKDNLFQQAWLSSGPVHWATRYNETYPKEIIEDFMKKYVPKVCEVTNMTHFCRHELFKRTKTFLNPDLFWTYSYALDPGKILKNILELKSLKGWMSVGTVPPLLSGAPGLKNFLESGGKLVFTTMGYEFENMPGANDYVSKIVAITKLRELFKKEDYSAREKLIKIFKKYERDLTIKDIFLKILSTILYHCPKNSLLRMLKHPNAYHITYDLKLEQTYTGAQNYYAKTRNEFNHTFHGIELEAITYEYAPPDINAGVDLFFRFVKRSSHQRICSNEIEGLYGCIVTKEGLNNNNFTLIHKLCSNFDAQQLISVAMKY